MRAVGYSVSPIEDNASEDNDSTMEGFMLLLSSPLNQVDLCEIYFWVRFFLANSWYC